ncbi:MAG: HAMP domain-containing sensor histidine kinase [Burkholderiaceae bacterium]
MWFLKRYPSSFLRLILVGYGVVLLPLLFASAYGLHSVEHLADDGESSMRAVVRAERFRREVADQMLAMERLLRQELVVRDLRLMDDYATLREEWRQTTLAFMKIDIVEPLHLRFVHLLEVEDAAYRHHAASREDPARVKALVDAVASLRVELAKELEWLDEIVAGAVTHFRVDADEMKVQLALVVALALPLSLAIVTLFRATLDRLFGSFERAVAQLGGGRLDEPIALEGPTDVRAMGERLDWLRRRLADLESERSRFLRSVSHELKTPLASLREGAQLLSDGVTGALTPQQRTVTQIMGGSVLRLQGLIDDMLKLQRTVYEAERIRPEAVDLVALVREVLTAQLLSARPRGVRFGGTLMPVTVHGGAEQLRLAIGNLASNAVKYSPDGGEVTVSVTQVEGRALVDVRDEGPGIPPAERERIFEAFFRAKQSGAVEGSGLGLAIAMECVAAHRGTIELLDSPKGAWFRLTVPVDWGAA